MYENPKQLHMGAVPGAPSSTDRMLPAIKWDGFKDMAGRYKLGERFKTTPSPFLYLVFASFGIKGQHKMASCVVDEQLPAAQSGRLCYSWIACLWRERNLRDRALGEHPSVTEKGAWLAGNGAEVWCYRGRRMGSDRADLWQEVVSDNLIWDMKWAPTGWSVIWGGLWKSDLWYEVGSDWLICGLWKSELQHHIHFINAFSYFCMK